MINYTVKLSIRVSGINDQGVIPIYWHYLVTSCKNSFLFDCFFLSCHKDLHIKSLCPIKAVIKTPSVMTTCFSFLPRIPKVK